MAVNGMDTEAIASIASANGMDAEAIAITKMRDAPADEDVQAHGCEALAYVLGARHGMLNDDEQMKVVEAGGLQVIVKAMKEFPKSEEVQEHGCCALGRLAFGDSTTAVVEAGGLQVIVKAMTEFPKSEKVQQFGCLALGSVRRRCCRCCP